MPSTGWTPRIVPYGADQTVYLVIDRFGGLGTVYRETEVERADLETIITDLMSGQFNDPVRVVAFNTLEHWSANVSEDIATEIQTRCGRYRVGSEHQSLEGVGRDLARQHHLQHEFRGARARGSDDTDIGTGSGDVLPPLPSLAGGNWGSTPDYLSGIPTSFASAGSAAGGSGSGISPTAATTSAAPSNPVTPAPVASSGITSGSIADYFLRGVIIILGFIFVAIGLNMFRPEHIHDFVASYTGPTRQLALRLV
jgi:hypothetical protein